MGNGRGRFPVYHMDQDADMEEVRFQRRTRKTLAQQFDEESMRHHIPITIRDLRHMERRDVESALAGYGRMDLERTCQGLKLSPQGKMDVLRERILACLFECDHR